MLDRIESLPGLVQRAGRGGKGSLRTGTISAALLSQALTLQRRMRASLPDAHVIWTVLSLAAQVHALRQQCIDLAFVHTPLEHDGLAVRAVLREPPVLAVSVARRELRDETFIVGTRDRGPRFYGRCIVACHDAGFEPRLDEQRQTLVNFVAPAALEAGIALLPRVGGAHSRRGRRLCRPAQKHVHLGDLGPVGSRQPRATADARAGLPAADSGTALKGS